MMKVLARYLVRLSRYLPASLSLRMWALIGHQLPHGRSIALATLVTEAFPLDESSAAFYSHASPRWAQEVTLQTNPRCIFARHLSITGVWENSLTSELLASRSPGLFVDVGAHYGYFSTLWLSRHPENRCLAIEPIPFTCALLRENLRPFGDRADVAQVCIGDDRRTIHMAYDPDWPMIANVAGEGVQATMMPLEDLLVDKGEIAVLKVDAEGWDVRILRSSLGLFRERRVRRVYWETSTWDTAADAHQPELVRALLDFGYVQMSRPGLDMAFEIPPS